MSADDIVFFDTNILVYADDSSDPRKKSVSADLVLSAMERSAARVSSQALSEYFVTVTKKIESPLPFEAAARRVELFMTMPVIPIDAKMVLSALSAMKRYGLAYWDALIVCAASASGARILYSEDFNAGQSYFDVKVVNPYR
jgi:predicted nucleic acid-binding protein